MSDIKKNKFESNNKYFTISVYVIAVVFLGAIIVNIVMHFHLFKNEVKGFLDVLNPFFMGAFIAYVLNPIVKQIDANILIKVFHIKSAKARKFVSILSAYLLLISIISIAVFYILPQLFESLSNLIQVIPKFYKTIYNYINTFGEKYPNIDLTYLDQIVNDSYPEFMKYLRDFAANFVPLIFTTSISVIKWIFNLLIAIIVSCYILIDKKTLLKNFKRLTYAFLKENKARLFINTLKECNVIFGSFIVGKTIDSTIIGFICFLLMVIFRIPYGLLISVIVGVTDLIPYFGPFIGSIPGVLILVLIDPVKALVYLILVIVLHQFDGLYLGPKILGISTGLKPLWIIFAIAVGGSLAGVPGMFFGVPSVAVIAFLINKAIERRLVEKNIKILPEETT